MIPKFTANFSQITNTQSFYHYLRSSMPLSIILPSNARVGGCLRLCLKESRDCENSGTPDWICQEAHNLCTQDCFEIP